MKRYEINWRGLRTERPEGEFVTYEDAQAAIQAAVLAERETNAQLADQTVCDQHTPTGIKIYGRKAGDAIRARAQK